jgi:hypothetical protein
MDVNPHSDLRIGVPKGKMERSAVPDASQRNHVTSLNIIASIERLIVFGDICFYRESREINAVNIQRSCRWEIARNKSITV